MVTMNQRLDAETLTIVADEFDHEVEFVTADLEESIQENVDLPEKCVVSVFCGLLLVFLLDIAEMSPFDK